MDAEENEKHVSLRAHSPWKSQKARFPHSHRRDDNADGKVEIQKQDSHFPTGSISLFKPKKEGLAASRYAPGPGSSCMRIKSSRQAHS
jgi:hypothetical protein